MKITTKAVFDIASGTLLHWEGFDYDGPLAHCGGGPSQEQKDAAAANAKLAAEQAATSKEMLGLWKDQYAKINPWATGLLNSGLPFMPQLDVLNRDLYGATTKSNQALYDATTGFNNDFFRTNADFANGLSARNAVGARANLLRSIGGYEAGMPNGFKAQLLSDLENQRRRDFDAGLSNALYTRGTSNLQALGTKEAGNIGALSDLRQNILASWLMDQQARERAAAMLTGQQAAANPLGWSNASSNTNYGILSSQALANPGIAGAIGGAIGGIGGGLLSNPKIPF